MSITLTNIRGYYHVPGVFSIGENFSAPNYCYSCGEPFPWTARSLEAAEEMADLLEGLTTEDRESLKASLPDLLKEGPRTPVAEARFKAILKKAGPAALDAMKKILMDVMSEAVKKSIFGP